MRAFFVRICYKIGAFGSYKIIFNKNGGFFMMKNKIHFICSMLVCGSLQCAMTPAGRSLVPQGQLPNSIAQNPAQLQAALDAGRKGKVNYVHPAAPATELHKQKMLDEEVAKTVALRTSRVEMLSKQIKVRYFGDISYTEILLDLVIPVLHIKSALYGLCIDTTGCNAECAVREFNAMYSDIPGMGEWINGTQAFPVIEELRNQNCRFNKLVSILHDNMGMFSFRNYKDVTGSTLDAMMYKKDVYPDLPKELRDYLVRKDRLEYQAYFPKGSTGIDENMNDNFAFWALENSKDDFEQLKALRNSLAFQQTSKRDSELVQQLEDYKMRLLYAGTDSPACVQAIKLMNTLYDPQWIKALNHYSNDADKFAHIDKIREHLQGRGSLDESLSALENGMKEVSFVGLAHNRYKNIMGSTVDEVMYKTHMYPTLKQFWRDYLLFKDKQKWEQHLSGWKLDRAMVFAAIDGSYGNKQELSDLENSTAWKNYLQTNNDTSKDTNFVRQHLQEYKDKAQQ
jgi:hypothetical protein